jgi:uncharacterized protein (TIGR03000 family)
MLRRLTTLAALTALAIFCSLLTARSAAAQEQGWFYSHPSSYSSSRSSSYSRPANYYAPPNASYAPTSQSSDGPYYTSSDSLSDHAARVSVHVPANAEVWFDGTPSRQRGERRRYLSPPLDPASAFYYDVRARWVDANGRPFEQTRRVTVRAGQLSMVDFLRQTR